MEIFVSVRCVHVRHTRPRTSHKSNSVYSEIGQQNTSLSILLFGLFGVKNVQLILAYNYIVYNIIIVRATLIYSCAKNISFLFTFSYTNVCVQSSICSPGLSFNFLSFIVDRFNL